MVAVPYTTNSEILRHHYGSGLPTFKGARMQYGKGFGSLLKRFALPLLSKGAKMVAPHFKKAAKGVVMDVMGNFMNHKGAMAPMPPLARKHKKRKPTKQLHSKKKKTKRVTSDIF